MTDRYALFQTLHRPTRPLAWMLSFSCLVACAIGADIAGAQALDGESAPVLWLEAEGSDRHLPAPLVESHFELEVRGPLVRGVLRQTFGNPTTRWVEALYQFPLPENTAVEGLRLYVENRVLEGRVEERKEARRQYARARKEGARASLVEQHRPNAFMTRVANVGPGEYVEVELDLGWLVVPEDGLYRLSIPNLIAPRYAPAASELGDFEFFLMVTPGLEPSAASTSDIGGAEFSIDVELEAGFSLAQLDSPSHPLVIEDRNAKRVHIAATGQRDRNFVLEWQPKTGKTPAATLLVEETPEGAYLLMLIEPPPSPTSSDRVARELILVLDVSGSMAGASLAQAKAAALAALDDLDDRDHFNVMTFSDSTTALFGESLSAFPDRLAVARQFIRDLEAEGGTEMLNAIERALVVPNRSRGIRQIVFVTDGGVSNEDEIFQRLSEDLGSASFFPVGIGSAPNTHLLARAAEIGRGRPLMIASVHEVERKMGEFLDRLSAPLLTSLEVRGLEGAETWPPRLPDLYRGEPIVLTAFSPHPPDTIDIRGHRMQQQQSWNLHLADAVVSGSRYAPREGPIARLWARRKIAHWMRLGAIGADADEVRKTVLETALAHQIVSKYTSLVVTERAPSRPASEAASQHMIGSRAPNGAAANLAGMLPRTATRASLSLLCGLLLCSIAGLLWLFSSRRAADVAL